jgi:hypothetical protein
VGALNDLRYSQNAELISQRLVLTSQFKTGLQFGLQPVIISDLTAELLQLYMDWVRPKLMEAAEDPLFVNMSGTQLRLGRAITDFFKRILSINISSTTIRSIVETESAVKVLAGEMSPSEKVCVENINGHSGRTAKKFYEKRSIVDDAALAVVVHRKLSRVDDTGADTTDIVCVPSDVSTISTVFSISEVPPIDVIGGTLHPSFGEIGRRVKWTTTEVNIVGNWCSTFLETYPDCNNVVSKCLQYIKQSDDVRAHFHAHHLADSTRLRWGWDKFREDK